MDPREFPTKGNLMLAKNSLALARQGFDLMDKKRNVLLKELMTLIDEAKDTHVCSGQILSMASVKCRSWHIRFRLKIRFVFRPEVLWERRFRW